MQELTDVRIINSYPGKVTSVTHTLAQHTHVGPHTALCGQRCVVQLPRSFFFCCKEAVYAFLGFQSPRITN